MSDKIQAQGAGHRAQGNTFNSLLRYESLAPALTLVLAHALALTLTLFFKAGLRLRERSRARFKMAKAGNQSLLNYDRVLFNYFKDNLC